MRKCCLLAAVCLAGLCCTGCFEQISNPETESSLQLPEITVSTLPTTTSETTTVTTTTAPPPYSGNLTRGDGCVQISGVPKLEQSRKYATACESLAAVALLQYYGLEIDIDLFISQYLPIADYPVLGEDRELHAESPWDFFIGDPARSNGFGCYSGAIVKAVNAYVPELAEELRDVPLSQLCTDYIDRGEPVLLWATIGMAETRKGHSWILPDGSWFTFIRPEHALVLIGYNEDSYIFVDSLADGKTTAYPREAVEKAYAALYAQAVVIRTDNLPQT